MKTSELVKYLDKLLEVDDYQDYAPNGLQIEGVADITRIVTGVTASQALIDKAIELNADAILVHHGYFWKGESSVITGMKQQRIKKLLAHSINLIAYHLPLDGHAVYGNNAQLAKLWGLKDITQDKQSLLRLGELPEFVEFANFKLLVEKSLKRAPLHLPGGSERVKTIAWCSGGAQNYIEKAKQLGADVFISGEVSEQTTHIALEEQIHYLAAGHHATERQGVRSLGEHLQGKFKLDVIFIDVVNPV